jgi:3-mercaptopyruvate sulfurtransferase SseA
MLNFLQASDSIFVSPKVALKMIDKNNITFLSLDNASLKIKGSKYLDINLLESSDILGRTGCFPLYVCSDILKKYFSKLGIDSNDELVIYDNSYGISSATLYVMLEHVGHKNISILRGGLNEIAELDLNWKIYNNYLAKLKNED